MSTVNGPDNPAPERQGSQPTEHADLYVRAGQDGSSLGGCPFCHRMFMVLMIKHNAGALTFTATTVDPAHPARDWKLGSRLPILVHKDEALSEVEEMISYVDKTFPEPPMLPELPKANEACVNAFSKFNFYVKNQSSRGPEAMLNELRKLDSFLQESPHKFLCGDEISHLDCLMLPKLQHIRIVAKAFKDFDIPSYMKGLWGYLANGYDDSVFVESCPCDQEIVFHWQGRTGLPPLSKEAAAHYKTTTKPRYSFDVPEELRKKPQEQQNEVPAAQQTPPTPSTPTTPATPTSPTPDAPAAFAAPTAQEPVPPPQEKEATPEPPTPPPDYEVVSPISATSSAPPPAETEAPPAQPPAPQPEVTAEKAPEVESAPGPPAVAEVKSEPEAPPAVDPTAPPQSPIDATPAPTETPPAVAEAPVEPPPSTEPASTEVKVKVDDTQSPPPPVASEAPPGEPESKMNGDISSEPPKYAAEPYPIS